MLIPTPIHDLPKVELHPHVEGKFESDLIMQVAERNGIRLPRADIDERHRQYEFTDLVAIVGPLHSRGVQFRSLTEPVDATTAGGELFFQICAAFAQTNGRIISERTTACKRRENTDPVASGGF